MRPEACKEKDEGENRCLESERAGRRNAESGSESGEETEEREKAGR